MARAPNLPRLVDAVCDASVACVSTAAGGSSGSDRARVNRYWTGGGGGLTALVDGWLGRDGTERVVDFVGVKGLFSRIGL